jgi:hypothetical protein
MMLVLSTTGAPVAWVIGGVRSVMMMSSAKTQVVWRVGRSRDFVECAARDFMR